MKTKIVYDVVCSVNDLYYEQLLASVWTLKHYNPMSYVVLLTDEASSKAIEAKGYKETHELIDEIKIVEINDKLTNKEKSRWIKTSLRNLIKGDFLFIDADTIVCGALDELEKIECFVGAVLDYHCHAQEICQYEIFKAMTQKPLKDIFGLTYQSTTDVYNSGFLLVRDVPEAYKLFDAWHANWEISRSKGECRDQLSLTATNQQHPGIITEISGIYNCQLRYSVQYFFDAKVLHTFASQGENNLSMLFGNRIYRRIKEEGCISESTRRLLLNAKKLINSPSIMLDKEFIGLSFTPAFLLLRQTFEAKGKIEKFTYWLLNFMARALSWVLNHKKFK